MTLARNNKAGFTLLELIVVMIVLAIIAGIAAPRLAAFAKGRGVADSASTLVSHLRWAQSQAMSEGEIYRINIDTNRGAYSICKEVAGQSQAIQSEMGLEVNIPDDVHLETDLPLDGNIHIARFYPGGRLDPGEIHLTRDQESWVVGSPTETEPYHVITQAEVK